MVFDVVEECFSAQLYDAKKTEASDKIIDEVVQFRDNVCAKIHASKTKKDFPAIRKEVEEAAVDFVHKINGLY